jgi:hypothetical protein
MPAKKVCFFVTHIGKPDSAERKRADNIKKYILNDVLSGKFKVVRADDLPQPGSITHQVIKLLYDADLVVADLTGANPNVVYELAIRHSFNKISIHLIDRSSEIPFDLKDERTILFDLSDPDSLNYCKEEIVKTIKEMARKRFVYHSPIFRVLGIAAATDEEREKFLEQMADQIDSIATDVSSIETDVSLLSSVDLDDVEKDIKIISKDIYELKQDMRRVLEKLK